MSVEKAMTSEPSNGSAKVISVELEKVTTFNRVSLWKENFCLPVLRGVLPPQVPGL